MLFHRFLPVAALLVAAAPSHAGTLTIQVENVRASKGRVHVDVCTEVNFVSTKLSCPFTASAVARAGVTTVVVPNLPAGRFAVQAYLDENNNGKMDFNMFHLPKEQFGFSRDFRGMRAPKFEEAAFNVTGAAQSITLHLHSAL